MKGLPGYVRRVFALASGHAGEPLSQTEWPEALAFADRVRVTLLLENAPPELLPPQAREEIMVRAAKNEERNRRLKDAYVEIAHAFEQAGIAFVLLKGFTHSAVPGIPSRQRVQYDLDLLCAPEAAHRALAALRQLGYAPHIERTLSDQHLPAMVRPHSWHWRNDYFDPEMPIAVDLHPRVWAPEGDRIKVAGTDEFWLRRTTVEFEGMSIPAFAEPDRIAYAALHALRHILRNDANPAHVYEIGRMLARRPEAAAPGGSLHLVESVVLRFAAEWFGFPCPAGGHLSRAVEAWFQDCAWSPLAALLSPNKDAVWLHTALLDSTRDRLHILRRSVMPLRRPRQPASQGGWGRNVMARVAYHTRAIAPLFVSGMRWWRRIASSTPAQISR